MCSTVQEQITTCGQNAIVKIGERTNIRPQKRSLNFRGFTVWLAGWHCLEYFRISESVIFPLQHKVVFKNY